MDVDIESSSECEAESDTPINTENNEDNDQQFTETGEENDGLIEAGEEIENVKDIKNALSNSERNIKFRGRVVECKLPCCDCNLKISSLLTLNSGCRSS